jgi:hypothetical protein
MEQSWRLVRIKSTDVIAYIIKADIIRPVFLSEISESKLCQMFDGWSIKSAAMTI